MKRLLPGSVELAILTLLATLSTVAAILIGKPDKALFFVTIPLFISCTLMGMRRNGQLSNRRDPSAE